MIPAASPVARKSLTITARHLIFEVNRYFIPYLFRKLHRNLPLLPRSGVHPPMVLDDIDATIMDILQKKGRTRRNDLAEAVGLSLPSVSERLRKLEENGYITGYFATVDPRKLGKDICAFIFVTVDSSKHYPGFLEHAHATDEILECHAITGEGLTC